MQLLKEAHQTPYSMYPGATKIYQDLKQRYWWPGMKQDIVDKAEHQRLARLLQRLEILEWKWE